MRTLIGQGADLNYNDPKLGAPLHHASAWGKIEAMEFLLEAGANPNIAMFLPNLTFATPLSLVLNGFHQGMISDRKQASDAIRLLLSYGADINHPSVQKAITNQPALGQLLKEAGLAKLP